MGEGNTCKILRRRQIICRRRHRATINILKFSHIGICMHSNVELAATFLPLICTHVFGLSKFRLVVIRYFSYLPFLPLCPFLTIFIPDETTSYFWPKRPFLPKKLCLGNQPLGGRRRLNIHTSQVCRLYLSKGLSNNECVKMRRGISLLLAVCSVFFLTIPAIQLR